MCSTRLATRVSRICWPSAVVAPVGSPSTPLGDAAATPPVRKSSDQFADRRNVPGRRRLESNQIGSYGQHQRRFGATCMRVATRNSRRPGSDGVSLGNKLRDRRSHSLLVATMAVHQGDRTEGQRSRSNQFDDDETERLGPDRQCSRKTCVFTTRTERKHGRHDCPDLCGSSRRYRFGNPGVGVEWQVRTMLLC